MSEPLKSYVLCTDYHTEGQLCFGHLVEEAAYESGYGYQMGDGDILDLDGLVGHSPVFLSDEEVTKALKMWLTGVRYLR